MSSNKLENVRSRGLYSCGDGSGGYLGRFVGMISVIFSAIIQSLQELLHCFKTQTLPKHWQLSSLKLTCLFKCLHLSKGLSFSEKEGRKEGKKKNFIIHKSLACYIYKAEEEEEENKRPSKQHAYPLTRHTCQGRAPLVSALVTSKETSLHPTCDSIFFSFISIQI